MQTNKTVCGGGDKNKPKRKKREETRKRITYYFVANACVGADLFKIRENRNEQIIQLKNTM